METVIISIICIALMVFGGMTMSQGFMSSVDSSTTGLSEVSQTTETIMRTELTKISAVITNLPGPNDPLDIVLENTGKTKIADFDKWDVIVQYYSAGNNYNVSYLSYNGTGTTWPLPNNQWEVYWIRLNGVAETFEPNVLNPGEQIMIRALLSPAVSGGTTNMLIISAPNGVTCSTYFIR